MSRRVVLPKAGGWDVFKIEQFEVSGPSADEIQVDVKFSGLNFADIHMRQGLYPEAPKFPFTPGYEFSGIITKVGDNVDGLKVGDRVFGGSAFYCYQSTINISSKHTLKLPDDYSLEEGASILVSFVTAYVTLVEQARIRSGDKVLIDCITGGLGQACHQILKGMDVEIFGATSSKSKIEFISKMGVTPITHEELEANTQENFDFILNSQGGKSIKSHYKKLNPLGRIICLGASSGIKKGNRSLVKALKMFVEMPRFGIINLMNDNLVVGGINVLRLFENPEFLIRCAAHFEFFNYRPNVDKVFPAAEVGEAQRYIEEKKSKGKVLISW